MNTQKKMAAALAVAAGVGAAVAGGVAPRLASAQPTPRTATVLANSQAASEAHPKVEAALRYLHLAESNLGEADHDLKDFGGHRMKAEQLTLQAILETRKALAYGKH